MKKGGASVSHKKMEAHTGQGKGKKMTCPGWQPHNNTITQGKKNLIEKTKGRKERS